MMTKILPKPIVFFDGQCPYCSKEIAYYQKLPESSELIWADIHTSELLLKQYKLSKTTALSKFHVMDANSQWQIGAYAFVTIWSYFRGWRLLSSMIQNLYLTNIIDRVYNRFAQFRLRKSCNDIQCSPSK